MKLLVLLNDCGPSIDGARPEDLRRRIADGFSANGADADVRLATPRDLTSHVQEAVNGGFDAVVAAGDEKVLNDVVNAIATSGRKAFAILPLGNRHPFARDLGMPTDLDEAICAIAGGSMRDVFVGEVNGRIFLTLCAIGLDPAAFAREGGKYNRTTVMSMVRSSRSKHDVRLSTRGHAVVTGTPCAIVSNCAAQLEAFGLNARANEPGLMNIYVARRPHLHGRLRRLLQRLPGRSLPPPTHFQAMALPEMRLDSPHRRKLQVCIDGEMLRVRAPLHFLIRRVPMRVLAPAASA